MLVRLLNAVWLLTRLGMKLLQSGLLKTQIRLLYTSALRLASFLKASTRLSTTWLLVSKSVPRWLPVRLLAQFLTQLLLLCQNFGAAPLIWAAPITPTLRALTPSVHPKTQPALGQTFPNTVASFTLVCASSQWVLLPTAFCLVLTLAHSTAHSSSSLTTSAQQFAWLL